MSASLKPGHTVLVRPLRCRSAVPVPSPSAGNVLTVTRRSASKDLPTSNRLSPTPRRISLSRRSRRTLRLSVAPSHTLPSGPQAPTSEPNSLSASPRRPAALRLFSRTIYFTVCHAPSGSFHPRKHSPAAGLGRCSLAGPRVRLGRLPTANGSASGVAEPV